MKKQNAEEYKKKDKGADYVAITGGHFSPAYACVEAAVKQRYKVLFFGRKNYFDNTPSPTLEHAYINHLGNVEFISIASGRFNIKTSNLFNIFKHIIKTILAVIKSTAVLYSYKPKYVISFGGYIGAPVCIAAALLRIPVYLHDQTIAPGSANRILSIIAKQIFTAFPEAVDKFPSTKTKIIGNPYHTDFFSPQKPKWLKNTNGKPILLIMGGSSGAHEINKIVRNNILFLKKNFAVVHQTGVNIFKDYEILSQYSSSTYIPRKQLFPSELAYLLSCAHIAITRTGANTFFLLIYYKLPCITMPLSISAHNEQKKHSDILVKSGVAYQKLNNKDIFRKRLVYMEKNYKAFKKRYNALSKYKNLVVSGEKILNAIKPE